MGLDIRLPIGLLFAVIGLLLTGFGAFSGKEIYHRSLDVNVNLAWGALMLCFGVIMVIMGSRRGALETRVQPPADTKENVAGRRG